VNEPVGLEIASLRDWSVLPHRTQDYVLGYSQPSLAGLVLLLDSATTDAFAFLTAPRTASWAIFSRAFELNDLRSAHRGSLENR
jgi:hypothetical protein